MMIMTSFKLTLWFVWETMINCNRNPVDPNPNNLKNTRNTITDDNKKNN